ncbi:MAG: LytTR family transcriptional regulator [Lachnospiraceae bacterium]|nr:LytTR family transcriptional regulator [Lachnospiraceae bacterium]
MQIEVKIDSTCTEPKVIVQTDRMTEEVEAIIKKLTEAAPQILTGFQGDALEVLEPMDIIRIYANSGKVFAVTQNGEYTLKLRLYELEERLDKNVFVRISNSEIINLKKVKGFDLSFVGTICVKLANDTITYVSRRYVARIKQVLGV